MRNCNGCTLCCLFAKVSEINKPENILCKYCTNSSCSIYEKRPIACSSYYCEWALGNTPEELKPDEIGIMFEKVSDDLMGVYIVKEKQHSWLTPKVQEFCDSQIKNGISFVTNTQLVKLSEGKTQESVVKDIISRIKWQEPTPQI